MFLNCHAFLILVVAVSTITATKCGNYVCHDNTECTFDDDKKEMKCICPKDFTTTFGDNNVYCCQKEDTKCGPNHQCNKELQCKDLTEEIEMPVNSETIECDNGEQRCQDKCCALNEICHEGKACVANENCPLDRQCAHRCCKETESCSTSKECIENLSLEANICAVEKQCNGKCCAENEICSATKECIIEANVSCPAEKQCNGLCCNQDEICSATKDCIIEANASCPAEKQCAEKCCKANELCSIDKQCIEKEFSRPDLMLIQELCPAEKQCNGLCCNQDEICSENKICIDQHNICPEEKQCFGKCCSEEEICTEDKKCLPRMLAICSKEKICNNKICCNKDELCWENVGCGNKNNCQDSRICLEKCCHANETCNEQYECIDCPLKQQCQGKCCADNEICFEGECYVESVNDTINLPECPKQLQCGEICCDSNDICSEDFKCLKQECLKCGEFCCKDKEICSEALECKAIATAYADCPISVQQCNGKCCAKNEICTERKTCECPALQKCHGKQCCATHETCHVNECVNKNLLNLLGLYTFPKESRRKLNNNMNDIVELYDFENSNTKGKQCPADQAPCREHCCQPQQFCNTLGQCEENLDDDVEPYADITPLGYHSLGVGCLVFAVVFALFKVICACMQSQQYVLK